MNNTFIVIILFMTIGFIMYISSCLNDIFSFGNLLKTQYQTFYSNFLPQSELEANLVEMTSTTQPFPAFINNLKYFFYMVFCICGALYALLNIKRKNTLKSVFSISVGGFFLFLFIIANYFGSYMSSGRILILLLIFLSISSSSILYQFLFFNKKTIFKILFISFVGFYIIFNSIQIPSYILPSNELIRGPFNIDKNINWYHDTQQDVSVTFLEKFNIQSNINGQLAMPNYNYRESQKFNSSDIKYNKKIRTIYIVETGFANGHILNWNPNYSNIVKNQKFYNSGNIEISTT